MDDDTTAALEALIEAADKRPDERDLRKKLAWLVDTLVARGQLGERHRMLVDKIRDADTAVRLSQVDDKRSVASPDIDCASLLHLCKARCCTFSVSLSLEDLREGRLTWDLRRPYVLERRSDGHCTKFSSGCTVYDDRPATCRSYDCRDDRRVWQDFAKKIPTAG